MADRVKAKRLAKERMKCNSPRRDIQGGKKSVVKACEGGEEKIIRFGDANMEIKRDNPERRKNFRARHSCDEKKSKLTAGYCLGDVTIDCNNNVNLGAVERHNCQYSCIK